MTAGVRRRRFHVGMAGAGALLVGTALITSGTWTPWAAAAPSPTLAPASTADESPTAATVRPSASRERTERVPGPARGPTPAVTETVPEPEPDTEPPAPVRVRIPTIGVDADIIELGLNPDRTLEVPADFDVTGWWTGRSVPGEPGPSIVVGHVDSRQGPAVFHRLRELEPGDVVEVDRDDGSIARFAVTETIMAPKSQFPTERVYGAVDGTALRLVTCGGDFDSEARSYRSNVIVFAEHLGNQPPTSTVSTAGT